MTRQYMKTETRSALWDKVKNGRSAAETLRSFFKGGIFVKRIFAVFACTIFMLCLCLTVSAVGDPNIETGGGGLGGGSAGNIWYGDSGVRVTVIDAESRTTVSASIDLIKPPEYLLARSAENIIHFGKVCKLEYNSGAALYACAGGYEYILPSQELPKIIATNYGTGSIAAIRSYFCDEQVLRGICGHLSFDYDNLISGDCKLLIEPLAAFTFNGAPYVMTATEAALYNKTVGGLRAAMGPLTHKNLPFALYLETSDMGYPAWEGATNRQVGNDDIISSLGLGIVRFTELPDEPVLEAFDYEYRVDTDVITSVEVSGGQSDPDNPVDVEFIIEGTSYTVSNVYYPEGDSQLAWVKWHTPSEPCVCTIRVNTRGGGWAESTITANIVDLEGHDPPNPVADDRNDSFRPSPVPTNAEVTTASWGIWSPWWQENWVWVPVWVKCWHSDWVSDGEGGGYWDDWYHWVDEGYWEDQGWWEFDYTSYSASLTADMKITPDDLSPSATAVTLKSGYGIQEEVTARVTTTQSSAVTAAQNAVTYFPEFGYKDYWRLLDCAVSGKRSTMTFKDNPYSTYNRPTHFTPIWYPDGEYRAYTWLLDCWTPAGMLSMNLTDSLTVSGNLWEEWHIAPTY